MERLICIFLSCYFLIACNSSLDKHNEDLRMTDQNNFQRLSNELVGFNTETKDGFILFKKINLSISNNQYEEHTLTEADKRNLPAVLEKNGFDYIIVNEKIYVEQELMNNPDFLSKVVDMLDEK